MTDRAESTERRRAELAANVAAVRGRIARACAAAGRAADEVTLVAVSKTFPASDVALLADLGVTDIGENRDQEAAAKVAAVAAEGIAVRWHFVGRLQRNKARSVASYADVVESVDSVRLAEALAAGAERAGRRLEVLVQVSLDADPGRGGALADPGDDDRSLDRVAAAVAAAPALDLAGLMAIAPLDRSADAAFATLAGIAERFRVDHPTATVLSAGMSHDLESAVAHGTTQVRIGSALLGPRGPLR
ncbi:MAG TPA: YggS family pyridoxal phosphate-dependent enzyme [Asanoa sp.]